MNPATKDWVEQTYHHHRQKVFNFCLRMLLNRDQAEDVLQETFARLCDRGQPAQPGLAYTIARNLCLDHLRQRQRRHSILTRCFRPDAGCEVEQDLVDRHVGFALLKELSPRDRSLLLLREYLGLDYKAIAEICGMSLNQVEVALCRARSRTQKLMEAHQ